MRQSTRLILNSAATFARMLITVGISLLATRLVFRTLGDSGFGVFVIVLAAATTLTIITDSLATSAMTRLAVEIGRRDEPRLRAVFATSVLMILAFGALIMLAVLTLGGPVLSLLEIPPGREHDAWVALQLVTAGVVFLVAGMPYRALLQAHQNLTLLAAIDILEPVVRLAAVILLRALGSHSLALFCWLLAGALLVHLLVQVGVAVWKFPEARPGAARFSREHLHRLLSFGWWDVLINACWRLRIQGAQFVLNVRFGEKANAAYQLAAQVGMYQNNVAAQLWRASAPAVVNNHAAGDTASVHRLVLVSSKYMLLVMSPLLAPILLETGSLLRVWLGEAPPPMTPAFLRCVAAWVFLYYASIGHQMAIQATGRLRGYALWAFGIDAAALGAGTLCILGLGLAYWTLPLSTLIATVLLALTRVIYVGPRIGLPFSAWLRRTILPVLLVCGPALGAACLVQRALPPGLLRIAAVMLAFGLVAAPLTWLLGLEAWEREHFRRLIGHGAARARGLMGRRVDGDRPEPPP